MPRPGLLNNMTDHNTNFWIPDQAILCQIEEFAQLGMTEKSMAKALGIGQSTFSQKKKDYPKMAKHILRGRAKAEEEVLSKLWLVLRDEKNRHHFAAVKFYLERRCDGWSNKQDIQATVKSAGKVSFIPFDKGELTDTDEQS